MGGSGDVRGAFAAAMLELGEVDERVFLVECDLDRAPAFAAKYPKRSLRVGVAEANAIGIAAGLALAGKVPFVATMASFVTMRACEQVRVDVCYNRTNVKLVGDGAGLSSGAAGPTHQTVEDVAIMRAMPNMTVVLPADWDETVAAVKAAAAFDGPVYVRIGRGSLPDVATGDRDFAIGRSVRLRAGQHATLIAAGAMMVQIAQRAAEELSRLGIEVGVLNMHTVKPIDEGSIVDSMRQTGRLVTIEDHSVFGGLGGAVAEVATAHGGAPVLRLGICDEYTSIPGSWADLLASYGLTGEKVASRVAEWIGCPESRTLQSRHAFGCLERGGS